MISDTYPSIAAVEKLETNATEPRPDIVTATSLDLFVDMIRWE
jgi:hypothetical protein